MRVVSGHELGDDEGVVLVSVNPVEESGGVCGLDVGVAGVECLLHACVGCVVPIQVGFHGDPVGGGVVLKAEIYVLRAALTVGKEHVAGFGIARPVIAQGPANGSDQVVFEFDQEIR